MVMLLAMFAGCNDSSSHVDNGINTDNTDSTDPTDTTDNSTVTESIQVTTTIYEIAKHGNGYQNSFRHDRTHQRGNHA